MSRSLDAVLSSVPDANRWKLDREIDFEHRDERGQLIPRHLASNPGSPESEPGFEATRHLGKIAESMTDWEGVIADHLVLSEPDRSDIRDKYPRQPELQR